MNRLFSFIFALVLVSSFANAQKSTDIEITNEKGKQTNSKKQREIHVLSYNIRHSNPPTKPGFIDLDAIARVIVESQAELVGLQEVDMFTQRSGASLDMVRELSDRTGLGYFYFSKGIDFQGGEYGTAILSKYPLSANETILLPAAEGTEQRTLSVVKVSLAEGETVIFANTHLDFTAPERTLAQAEYITQYFKEEKQAVILVGDFNATPTSPAIAHLDQMFTRTCMSDCEPTYPYDEPSRTIDFIMFKDADCFAVKSTHVIPEKYASDHLPVKAILLKNE